MRFINKLNILQILRDIDKIFIYLIFLEKEILKQCRYQFKMFRIDLDLGFLTNGLFTAKISFQNQQIILIYEYYFC